MDQNNFSFFFLTSCQLNKSSLYINQNDLWMPLKSNEKLLLNTFRAYLDTCEKVLLNILNTDSYRKSCKKAIKNQSFSSKQALRFFKNNFEILDKNLSIKSSLMTGYYEPEVKAYRYAKKGTYPIYKIDNKKYGKSIFKNSRKKINEGLLKNRGLEIAWVENEIEAFLHIQGSGRLRYPDGKIKKVRYAGSNERKYTAIGKFS